MWRVEPTRCRLLWSRKLYLKLPVHHKAIRALNQARTLLSAVVRRWSRFIKKMTASNVILQNPQTRYGSRDGELVEGSHDEKSLFGRGGLQIRANSATGWLWGCAESGWSGSALDSTYELSRAEPLHQLSAQPHNHTKETSRDPYRVCGFCRITFAAVILRKTQFLRYYSVREPN